MQRLIHFANKNKEAITFLICASAVGVYSQFQSPKANYEQFLKKDIKIVKKVDVKKIDIIVNSDTFNVKYPKVHEELTAILGERYVLDENDLELHGIEMSGYCARGNPRAVVYPESTEEVQKIVLLCNEYKIPLVPYAAGTSVEGHTINSLSGITLDCTKMTKILKVSKEDMDVVVQPGVGWVQLNEYCIPYGLFLGVDPAPGACIGGMCATCCSGTNAVRYGTMRNQVLNMTVVLANGTILKTGQRARKSSAGYNLAGLLIGSEGTLGIITEVTLKMRNIPEHIAVACVTFDTVKDAANATIEIMQTGVQMGAIELLDEIMVRACNEYSGMSLPEKPCILFKFTGSENHVDSDILLVKDIVAKHTKHEYKFAKDEEERDKLWGMRKHAFWAAQHYAEKLYGPNLGLMSTDVAVPISKLAQAIDDTKKDLKDSFLHAPIVGHVGDGNYHVCISFDPNDEKQVAEAKRLNESMVKRAIELDGTCTGEHGVGLGKKKYLVAELGEGSVELMRTIKKALDPNNILNPGKIIDVSS